jgi:riboflavin kinase / FMN adenylyltransferase
VHGAKRGRQMGYPTANVRLGRVKPALGGIFAVRCRTSDGAARPGVASLGCNPAVRRDGIASLEAHLFDYTGNLYGAWLAVEFVAKLRDEAAFGSLAALAEQIGRDCDEARRVLARIPTQKPA